MMKLQKDKIKGFTLIEIMVSISIFAVIMLLVSSSIYTVFDANRKSQSLRAVMDNLNLSLESMTRSIRFGSRYHCDITVTPTNTTRNCSGGASSIAILDSLGYEVFYRLNSNRIERSTNGGLSYQAVTGSDVTITTLSFRVLGSTPYSVGSDLLQPRVVIVIQGYAGVKATSRSTFTLQTTVSQRQFDSQ